MPQLRFMLASEGEYQFRDGRRLPTPEVCMLGPTMGATRFSVRGEVDVLGISVLPLGWLALGCESADRWVDRLYDMAAVHGPRYRDMLLHLRSCSVLDDEIEGLWAFLGEQLGPVPQAMLDLVCKIDQWLSENDSPQIEAIT
ncbi:MAG: hypothetical protein B7Z20_09135, partial [Sphingobium sp. 32-64-5]